MSGTLFRQETEAALSRRRLVSAEPDAEAWKRAYRLVRLVDHADLFLSLFRGDQWLRKHVDVEGAWPQGNGPVIAITFHWGAGMWALRHMQSQGRNASVLVRGIDRDSFSGGWLRYQMARLRLREVTRASGSRIVLSDKNSLYEMKRKLSSGISIIGLMDVPAGDARHYLSGDLLGRKAHFPRGLLYLAVHGKVPVVVYSMGINRQNGRRTLRIGPPLQFSSEEELLGLLTVQLDELLRLDSPAWHQWGGVQHFFERENGNV